jgi:urease gamma subunit
MREARDSDNRVEVRNYDNRLLGKLDVDAGIFEIAIKGCVTLMKIPPGTKIEFVHQPTNP